jgi:hypothetical protein
MAKKAQKQGTTMLKVVLVIFAVFELVCGLSFFFIPGVVSDMSGGNPVDYGSMRWPGGVMIALGIGALLVLRNLAKQGVLVTTLALAKSLAGLAMLYSWIMTEYSGNTGFIAVPTVIVLALAVLLWWGRVQARKVL